MKINIVKPKPWTPLTEFPSLSTNSVSKTGTTQKVSSAKSEISDASIGRPNYPIPLIYDVDAYPFDPVNIRIKRLGVSVREFEQQKRICLEQGLLMESSAGKNLHLIQTEKAFKLSQKQCPYEPNVIEHSFCVLWSQYHLKRNPRYRKVMPEYAIGNSGATGDVIAFTFSGYMEAYEVTLTTSHVLANAEKYTGTDVSRIVLLCRNYHLKEAVKACCREGGLSEQIYQKLEYMQLSSLTRYTKNNT